MKHTLSFSEWLIQQKLPKTGQTAFLKLIGYYDFLYLLYRMGVTKQKAPRITHEIKPIARAVKTTVVEAPPVTLAMKKPVAKKKVAVKKIVAKKKVSEGTKGTKETDVSVLKKKHTSVTSVPSAPLVPTPEPLIFEEPTTPLPQPTSPVWLGDASLEDADPRKTSIKLATDGIAVTFEQHPIEDEEETLIGVNGTLWRATMTTPVLNLSRIVQICRVSYGELYVLGRMALGAVSGEGYIPADEASRIVHALKEATGSTVGLDVRYYTKDSTSNSRTSQTIHVRFERVS